MCTLTCTKHTEYILHLLTTLNQFDNKLIKLRELSTTQHKTGICECSCVLLSICVEYKDTCGSGKVDGLDRIENHQRNMRNIVVE